MSIGSAYTVFFNEICILTHIKKIDDITSAHAVFNLCIYSGNYMAHFMLYLHCFKENYIYSPKRGSVM